MSVAEPERVFRPPGQVGLGAEPSAIASITIDALGHHHR